MNDFETYRPLLFGIAYRMLSSISDAEDIVQDAYLRYAATPRESIRSPSAFLATIVTRLCLNQLQSARVQRETYVGPWLPEPLVSLTNDYGPSDKFEEAESISMAFLVLLEQLTPLARAVFLLREVFDYDYAEIAEIVERDEAACRQLFSRARKELGSGRRRFQPTDAEHRRIVLSFMQATTLGDIRGLTNLLTEDVVLWADGGGKVRGAATRPIHGSMDVATFLVSSRRFVVEADTRFDLVTVNAAPGAILREAGKPIVVIAFEFDAAQICGLRLVANPDKLQRVQLDH